MKFLSVDIETSGLNKKKCVVFQLGIVAADLATKKILGSFRVDFMYSSFHAEPYATAQMPRNHEFVKNMDAGLKDLRKPKDGGEPRTWTKDRTVGENNEDHQHMIVDAERIEMETVNDFIIHWAQSLGLKPRFTLAGKNLAMFDLPFLENMGIEIPYRHRLIDPAILYAKADDEVVPELQTCLERAGFEKTVSHDAVEDAMDVVNLIFHKF